MTAESRSPLDSVERTALLTAALRAAETRREDRLFADEYAAAFAGDVGPKLLAEIQAVTIAPGGPRSLSRTLDYSAIRTRFFDDFLIDAAATQGMRQVVMAPAGMDSRAFRLRWPDGVRVFEVDRPAVIALKDTLLAGAESAVDRTTVAVDLRDSDWADDLIVAGYDPGAPSTWLIEGLLCYLPEAAVHRLLDRVRAITIPGSLVAADVVNTAALNLPGMRGLLEVFAGWGCPWLFGSDEPEELFARHGIDAFATQPGDLGAHYDRWPDPVPPRSVESVRRLFLVCGVRG